MARGAVPLPLAPAVPTRPRFTPDPIACRHLLGRKPAQNSDLQPDFRQYRSDLLSRQAGNLGQLLGEGVLNGQHSSLFFPIRPSYLRYLLGSQRPAQNRLNFRDDILVRAVLLANSRQHGSNLSFRNASRLRNLLRETVLSRCESFPRRSARLRDLPLLFNAQRCAQLRLQLLNQARTGPIWSLALCCRRSMKAPQRCR